MPKRKRSDYERPQAPDVEVQQQEEGEEGGEESARSILIHQNSVLQKLHHHRILLRRALKTAKGFELQKLAKRIKSARSGKPHNPSKSKDVGATNGGDNGTKEEEVGRLEKEFEAAKTVDLEALANRHLNKVLLKNKSLSTSRYFPPVVREEVEEQAKVPAPTGAVANVCARMLNANPVKEAMKEIIGNLERILGIEGQGEEDGVQAGKGIETEKLPAKATESKATIPGTDIKPKRNLQSKEKEDSDESLDDDSEDAVIHPSMLKNLAAKYIRNVGTISSDESEDESEDEVNGRVAWSSEDEGDEDENEDEDESEDDRPRGRSMSITPIPEDQLRAIEALENEALDIDLPDEDEEDSNPEISPPPPSKKSQNQKPKKQAAPAPEPAPKGPIKTSSFLPTLMTGYISGSDSDAASDISAENRKKSKKGPPEKKVRKNRMGQMARRAIAEKKYGTGANHVKKAKEEKEAKAKAKEERKKAWVEKQTKPVHASWQLKKKDKDEKDKIIRDMMAGKASGVGKKIVFE